MLLRKKTRGVILIINYSYFTEGTVDPIAVTAGLVQTGLYADFFYVYFTKYVSPSLDAKFINPPLGYCRDKSLNYPHELREKRFFFFCILYFIALDDGNITCLSSLYLLVHKDSVFIYWRCCSFSSCITHNVSLFLPPTPFPTPSPIF